MTEYYLGIDIGASSGRHILAHMEDGRMVLEEIHRFPNGMSQNMSSARMESCAGTPRHYFTKLKQV